MDGGMIHAFSLRVPTGHFPHGACSTGPAHAGDRFVGPLRGAQQAPSASKARPPGPAWVQTDPACTSPATDTPPVNRSTARPARPRVRSDARPGCRDGNSAGPRRARIGSSSYARAGSRRVNDAHRAGSMPQHRLGDRAEAHALRRRGHGGPR